MDLKGRISEIFNLGASQAGKLKNGKGSVDDKKDVQYIDNAIKALKAEADAEARERGIVDLQSLSQTEAEIDAMVNLEMQEMLGANFAKGLGIEKKADINGGTKYEDDSISLENLMSLLSDDVDAEGNAFNVKKFEYYYTNPVNNDMAKGLDKSFGRLNAFEEAGILEEMRRIAEEKRQYTKEQSGLKFSPSLKQM